MKTDSVHLLIAFLEGAPLYRKSLFPRDQWIAGRHAYTVGNTETGLTVPKDIKLIFPCEMCETERTFALGRGTVRGQGDLPSAEIQLLGDRFHTLPFRCTQCEWEPGAVFHLLLLIDADTEQVEVTKVGQYPGHRKEIAEALAKTLSKEDRDWFQKGLTCEAHGFGVGAFGYYR